MDSNSQPVDSNSQPLIVSLLFNHLTHTEILLLSRYRPLCLLNDDSDGPVQRYRVGITSPALTWALPPSSPVPTSSAAPPLCFPTIFWVRKNILSFSFIRSPFLPLASFPIKFGVWANILQHSVSMKRMCQLGLDSLTASFNGASPSQPLFAYKPTTPFSIEKLTKSIYLFFGSLADPTLW